jgi:pimeloyl-ACP methyl ester carboxylesterase
MKSISMDLASPSFLLFAQHGWADDNRAMLALAQVLATPEAHIVAPSLGYLQTWLRIAPLIEAAEKIALQTLDRYPNRPLRIVGHSMGGLIWLELLHRHPEWWNRVHSLVLVASPVGGSDLSRLIDPIGLGVGIAADLGKTRCAIAEPIAAQIPTLIIAGDLDGGSDGTVPVACTQFANAQFLCLPGLSHAAMRNHPAVASVIQEFWADTSQGEPLVIIPVINRLRAIEWVTDSHPRDFAKAKPLITLKDGSTLRTWRSPLGILHVYVAAPDGQCLYSGFIGWLHEKDLLQALDAIKAEEGSASATP